VTDIHYRVLNQLGYTDLPNSYIKLLIDWSFGVNSNPLYVDIGTATCFVFAMIGMIVTNWVSSHYNLEE